MSQNTKKEDFVNIFQAVLSKTAGTSKCLTLKHPKDNKDFVMADLRGYYNGKASRSGVCMTSFEFDWLANSLLCGIEFETALKSKHSCRSLVIKPKPKIKGVEVVQTLLDKTRSLNLREKEIKTLIEKYGTFYHIIEELEETLTDKEDALSNDDVKEDSKKEDSNEEASKEDEPKTKKIKFD